MAIRGIYKRGKTWWYRYADQNGKIQRKSSFSTKREDAEVKLREIKTAIDNGVELENRKKIGILSFNELADKYLLWIEGKPSAFNKKHTIKRLRNREVIVKGQSIKLGELPLRAFTIELVEQLQSSLRQRGLKENSSTGLKEGSINRILNTIQGMFTKASQWELISEKTLKQVHSISLDVEESRLRHISAKEAQALVNACDENLRPIVITALQTGMRKQEILKLTWDQVDLASGFIHLSKTKNKRPKDVPISATLREVLNKRPRRIVEVIKNGQKVKELVPYVFHNPDTFKPYINIEYDFKKAKKAAGIKDFRFHDLRHTFASLAIMSGKIDIATLSKLLGHTNLKQTMKYAHFAPDYLKKAASVMDEVLNFSTDTELTQATVSEEASN